MQYIFYISFFLIGLVLASFLNALVYRLDKEMKYPDIFLKPSHCEKCNKDLRWYDLIPVLSYILSKGKCTQCKSKIPIYYPISELYLGTTFLLMYIHNTNWIYYIPLLLLFSLSYHDYIYKAVPRYLVHILMGICILSLIFLNISTIQIFVILLITTPLLAISLIKKSFGFGDILVILSIGLILQYQIFLVFFWLTILLALIYSLVLIILRKGTLKSQIPLLPFFTISYTISLIYGNEIYLYFVKILGI